MVQNENGLAARLRWARTQQAITLHQLAERSGRAVSYLSQLEHGVRDNPTRETIEALARALGVRPAFLLGEVPEPPLDGPSDLVVRVQAWSLGPRFRAYWHRLADEERRRYSLSGPGERFSLIVTFLLQELPSHFNRVELAWQLGMSLPQFDEVMDGRAEVSATFMAQLAHISGVPLSFLHMGLLDEERVMAPTTVGEAYRLTAYSRPIIIAYQKGISPEKLEEMIVAYRGS